MILHIMNIICLIGNMPDSGYPIFILIIIFYKYKTTFQNKNKYFLVFDVLEKNIKRYSSLFIYGIFGAR